MSFNQRPSQASSWVSSGLDLEGPTSHRPLGGAARCPPPYPRDVHGNRPATRFPTSASYARQGAAARAAGAECGAGSDLPNVPRPRRGHEGESSGPQAEASRDDGSAEGGRVEPDEGVLGSAARALRVAWFAPRWSETELQPVLSHTGNWIGLPTVVVAENTADSLPASICNIDHRLVNNQASGIKVGVSRRG
jgi:hypothetical protein